MTYFGKKWTAVVDAALLVALATAGCGDDGEGADAGGRDGGGRSATACARGCDSTLAADCAQGPDSRAQCESDCERLRSGDCGDEYRALMRCADGEEVSCSGAGLPVIEACEAEQNAFVACLN